jgi:methylated-DNA-[protein]-cysteine S-methyltransferase
MGELLLAVTPRGLAYVAFEEEERDELLGRFSRQLSPRILEHPAATDEVRRQLEEYFEGERTRFQLKLDRRLMRGIARDVLAATARVPFGRTTTYGALAERIGRPRASRAVGNALGSNPIPIVVPCHRVLRTGGDVGGYAGGPSRKRRLLTLEGSLPAR